MAYDHHFSTLAQAGQVRIAAYGCDWCS